MNPICQTQLNGSKAVGSFVADITCLNVVQLP